MLGELLPDPVMVTKAIPGSESVPIHGVELALTEGCIVCFAGRCPYTRLSHLRIITIDKLVRQFQEVTPGKGHRTHSMGAKSVETRRNPALLSKRALQSDPTLSTRSMKSALQAYLE